MRVGLFYDDNRGSVVSVDDEKQRAVRYGPRYVCALHQAEPNGHCGGFGRAAAVNRGLKGEPYGWEVGWSLVTEPFRSRADN